jgi:hypothetical protein
MAAGAEGSGVIYSGSGQLPHHLYAWVDTKFIARPGMESGFVPVVWFGLTSRFGEMWGCNVMLECGGVYRNLPPHSLAFKTDPGPIWTEQDAQAWDCYGPQFSTIEYNYLVNVGCEIKDVKTKTPLMGKYLFTAVPLFDGYTRHPGQSKEFMFLKMDNGRLAIKSTDMVLFHDKSFANPHWPTNLRRQSETYHCESNILPELASNGG